MRFEVLYNQELIKATITHPSIYPYVGDVTAPAAAEYEPVIADNVIHLGVVDNDGSYCGLYRLEIMGRLNINLHTCILPCAWGQKAAVAAKEVVKYIFEELPLIQNITTMVPMSNRLALRYAKRAGMVEYGLLPYGWDGSEGPEDLILLHIPRNKEV